MTSPKANPAYRCTQSHMVYKKQTMTLLSYSYRKLLGKMIFQALLDSLGQWGTKPQTVSFVSINTLL